MKVVAIPTTSKRPSPDPKIVEEVLDAIFALAPGTCLVLERSDWKRFGISTDDPNYWRHGRFVVKKYLGDLVRQRGLWRDVPNGQVACRFRMAVVSDIDDPAFRTVRFTYTG